eukprot:TRINITY_DN23277_c0_g1_i1.p1 TRINITY_DN23277_c0_g1~~TRINITY_DN23277_c0_g1_i1.p1  ORF type:complete len:324 (+),score=75.80 TRINITY_DN23277_c0_g1_i1:10-981(+)
MYMSNWLYVFFFFQAEDGIRDHAQSRGLGDVYKRQGINAEYMGNHRKKEKNQKFERKEMKVEGLSAIVTGGASGLGKATVEALIRKGCRVTIADLNQSLGEELVKQFGEDKALFVKTDVSNEDNVKALVEAAVAKFGGLHIVVNSAGIISAVPIVTSKGVASTEEMLKVLRINVVGTFNVSKWAAAKMATQAPLEGGERGVIINVASVAGIEGQRGQVIYSASKGAILGMTLPMARDLGRFGIRVVTVAPGIFQTPMGKELNENIIKTLAKSTPLGRLGDPVEFAQFAIAIAENPYLTGSVLRLDGGIRLPHMQYMNRSSLKI